MRAQLAGTGLGPAEATEAPPPPQASSRAAEARAEVREMLNEAHGRSGREQNHHGRGHPQPASILSDTDAAIGQAAV